MSHPKFLEQVADYYVGHSDKLNLADITFIFPNKRSALFLKHYIQQRITDEVVMMPRFTTFSRFASQTSRLAEASRFELLFMLYKAYSDVVKEKRGKDAHIADFDKFIFWGDMILDDFDVIDSSLADAEKLYANLKGVRELTADYLTDEQKEIIRRLWGDTNLTSHIEGFWRHIVREDAPGKDMVNKFISLWEILAPLYSRLRTMLLDARLATPGMQMRKAMHIIRDTPYEKLRKRRYVFVGHADLSHAEIAIMERLKDVGCADFFWDLASPLFFDGKSHDLTNVAVRFVSRMAERFPMPDDFMLAPVEGIGEIKIIGVPSSVAQTKIAGEEIAAMNLDEKTAFDTAIVLPDPSQLMPMMLSLPENLPGVNITMGLPYSTTTFATLFSAIIAMQRRSRKSAKGIPSFFFQDVLEILLHPHVQLIAGEKAGIVRQYILDRRLFNIDAPMLLNHIPELSFIFHPIDDPDDAASSYAYVETLIRGLKQALSGLSNEDKPFEIQILDYFETQIEKLKELVEKYSITMRETTFISLFERILMSKSINMEGTPLKGLQVMGVLETRVLDFDNIIFLAMNERSLPKRDYVRTMIPNNLRRGYGLPSIEHTESFYSYYFFRAIGRASHVTLIYDSRPPSKGRGEMSRYLEQLIYVHSRGNVSHSVVDLSGSLPRRPDICIHKTPEVMEQLKPFLTPGSRMKISASALKRYLSCPLAFYFQYVNGLSNDNEVTDYIDASELGDIFHRSAKRIYDKFAGRPITTSLLQEIIDSGAIEDAVLAEVAAMQGLESDNVDIADLNAEGLLLLSHIRSQMTIMLEAEKSAYCSGRSFEYVQGEMDVADTQWRIEDLPPFNFRMQIDRIDRVDPSTLRFIDYKTGTDFLKTDSKLESLFMGNHDTDAILQLLIYAAAYRALVSEKEDIELSLHLLRDIVKEGKISPIMQGKNPLPRFSELEADFMPLLKSTVEKIFDDTTPFTQCEDVNRCKFCNFISVCGRNLPPDRF